MKTAQKAAHEIADMIERGENRLSGTYSTITIGPETRKEFAAIIQRAIAAELIEKHKPGVSPDQEGNSDAQENPGKGR